MCNPKLNVPALRWQQQYFSIKKSKPNQFVNFNPLPHIPIYKDPEKMAIEEIGRKTC